MYGESTVFEFTGLAELPRLIAKGLAALLLDVVRQSLKVFFRGTIRPRRISYLLIEFLPSGHSFYVRWRHGLQPVPGAHLVLDLLFQGTILLA